MSKKAKVESVETGNTWEKDGETYITHTYVLSDGQSIQANHKTEKPINVGEEVEYEVKRKHEKYGDSGTVKKPNDFKRGGYKKPTLALKDIIRMCKSNAIHAVFTVNASYSEERLKGDSLQKIINFTMNGLNGDIDKFGEDDSLLTSRLSSMNNASLKSKFTTINTAEELISEAQKLYNYIIK